MIRTLVVDDDFRVAELHRAYTAQVGGFEVVGAAHTAHEALEQVERLLPDLVLLDIYLPDASGLELLGRLHQRVRGVDVIAITAARDVETIRGALRGGALHYLIKPFTYHTFREKLESYAEVRARLQGGGEVDQAEVDRIYGHLHTGPPEELPKGISSATRDLVVTTLRKADRPVSAASVARAAGLSRVTARRYLEHLSRTGRAEVTMQYGSPGRPEHLYVLVSEQAGTVTPAGA